MLVIGDLIVAALATGAIVEGLRHGSLLSDLRVAWETTSTFTSRLLRCGFCSSYWAGAVAAVLVGPHMVFPDFWPFTFFYCVAVGLAAVRLANIINDLVHRFSRSPQRDEEAGQPPTH